MAASANEQSDGNSSADHAAGRVAALRRRARRLLDEQSRRSRQLEHTVSGQVARLLEQVNVQQAEAQQRESELQERITELEQCCAAGRGQGEAEELLQQAQLALSEALREQTGLKAQLDQHHRQLQKRDEQIEQLRRESNHSVAASEELAELRAERDKLASQLADLESAAGAAVPAADGDGALEDMQQRLQMATQEVRELKVKEAELTAKLAQRQSDSPPPQTSAFDWETQKQRLLAELESDFEPERTEDRLTVERAIRITDQVVAEKDEEIAELKKLLDQQSGSIGEMAVGAAAIAGVLDNDELIRQERENVKELQEQWQEKLRKAEVEIAVERAKLARERVAVEEKIRTLEARQAAAEPGGAGEPRAKNAAGGNWLARLGLKEE